MCSEWKRKITSRKGCKEVEVGSWEKKKWANEVTSGDLAGGVIRCKGMSLKPVDHISNHLAVKKQKQDKNVADTKKNSREDGCLLFILQNIIIY